MIYSKHNLVLRVLFENFRKKPIYGVFRPQAYIKASGKYSSTIRFDQFKKDLVFGEQIVLTAVLDAPVGYGKHLHAGVLMRIHDGLDDVGKVIVLEILGYMPDEVLPG
jgi:hypothetical protein